MRRIAEFRPVLSVLLATSLFSLSSVFAQAPAPVTEVERGSVVSGIVRLLGESYVFPEVGRELGEAITAKERSGAYAGLTDPFAFAEALTRDLQEMGKDRHLRVAVRPPGEPSAAEDPEAERRRLEEDARAEHYGFREVRMLPGNLGYLRIDGFYPTSVAGSTAVAALGFLRGSQALLVDLRQNGGGEPEMVQFLQSYLSAKPTHLNDFYWRKGDERRQVWTLPWVPGERLAEVPVFVLVGGNTFSGGEEFAYNLQALKRATLVGETTGGGANPGEGFDVGERFGLFLPNGRPINPWTGTNWEGTGVAPDLAVPAGEALLAAQGAALDALLAKARPAREEASLRYARYTVEAELHPYTPPVSTLPDYAGTYAFYRIVGGATGLYLERCDGQRRPLRPVAVDVFRIEGIEGVLLRFERDGAGRVAKGIGLYENGGSDEFPRVP